MNVLLYYLTCIAVMPSMGNSCRRAQIQGPDPEARKIIDQTVNAYASLSALREQVVCHFNGLGTSSGGGKQDQTIEIRLQRPNKLWIDLTITNSHEAPVRFLIVSDGKSLWNWNSKSNTYTATPAPPTLHDISSPFYSANLPDSILLLGEPEVMGSLRRKGKFPHPPVTNWFQGAKYLGQPLTVRSPEQYAEVETIVLTTSGSRLPQPEARLRQAMTVYIGRQDHLYRGMVVQTGGAGEKGQTFSFRNESKYLVVDSHPHFTPADFTFVPPQGSARKPQKPAGQKSLRNE